MLESFLEGTLYYDFPSFEVAIFSLLLSFVLSTFIALTYQWTYKGPGFPNSFFQAMVLSAVVTSMIMMAVGSNLAIGFGIIGAVAIIRFRTMIQNPRNIIFMFAAISIGIATGVYGYQIAIAGTIIFCAISFMLANSKYRTINEEQFDLVIIHNQEESLLAKELNNFCKEADLITQRRNIDILRSEYVVRMKDDISSKELFNHLKTVEGLSEVRIEKRANNRL